MNMIHHDEIDDATYERCPCCGRTILVPSRDEDHPEWCANRANVSDDEVEAFARSRGEVGIDDEAPAWWPKRGPSDTTALTTWRLALTRA